MLQLIGFDADDTLWHSEGYFRAAHAEFEAIVGRYVDVHDVRLHERMLATERRNLHLFGYGAKGMTLSMVETAIALTEQRIDAGDIHRLVELGKGILQHPVELLPGVLAAVEAVAADYPLLLITKGDLFHQEKKVQQSGLSEWFRRIEIVSEKDQATYSRVLAEVGIEPQSFVMIGNSLRSDIEPVLALGGWGVHLPYHVTWAHELDSSISGDELRLISIESAEQIPAAIRSLQLRAGDPAPTRA